jgi:hypothetical protein
LWTEKLPFMQAGSIGEGAAYRILCYVVPQADAKG